MFIQQQIEYTFHSKTLKLELFILIWIEFTKLWLFYSGLSS